VKTKNLYGLNHNGIEEIPCKYDTITGVKPYLDYPTFYGTYIVRSENLYGIYYSREEVIPCKYASVEREINDFFWKVKSVEGKYGLYSYRYKPSFTLPCIYDEITMYISNKSTNIWKRNYIIRAKKSNTNSTITEEIYEFKASRKPLERIDKSK
jgi:hypothetical protein